MIVEVTGLENTSNNISDCLQCLPILHVKGISICFLAAKEKDFNIRSGPETLLKQKKRSRRISTFCANVTSV